MFPAWIHTVATARRALALRARFGHSRTCCGVIGRGIRAIVSVMLVLAGPHVVKGQAFTFEPPAFSGSAAGTPLAGQQGWTTTPSGAVPFNVHTFAGHSLGFAANPVGGSQCISGLATATQASAQRSISFASGSLYRITFDIAVKFNGALPAPGNPGSVSLQPTGTSQSFRTLNRWTNPATADTWIAGYNIFDSAGALISSAVAGPEWEDLLPNRWYRQSTLIDFGLNKVIEVGIIDLHTGNTATVLPVDWYLEGGASPGLPRPTAIRCNINGAGNAVSWDNIRVEPVSVHHGLVHRALGSATLSRTASGALRIGNIGSSGQDGIEVALPNTPAYEMEFDLDPAMPVGASVRSTSRGSRGGAMDVSPGSLTLRRIASGFSAEADFGPAGSPEFTVVIRRDGTEVLRRSGLTGPAVEFSLLTTGAAKMKCSCTWWKATWRWIIGGGGSGNPPVEFRVGGQNVQGDEIEFLPTTPVSGFERMHFADTFISMPTPGDAVVDRQWVRSRGIRVAGGDDTIIQTELVQLSLTSLNPIRVSTVDVKPTGAEGLSNTMELDPSMPAGASMRSITLGVDAGGVSDLGSFMLERSVSGLLLSGDYLASGSPTYTLEAYLDGVLVASRSGLSGVGAETDLPQRVRIEIRCDFSKREWVIIISWDLRVSIGGGPPVFANELRMKPDVPPMPTHDDYIGRMVMRGMAHASSEDLAADYFGLLHAGLGDAVLDGHHGRGELVISNLGPLGREGVDVRLEPGLTDWGFVFAEPSVLDPGASMTLHTFGRLASGVVDKVSAAQALALAGGGAQVAVDFSPVGAPLVESNYTCAGTATGSEGVPGAQMAWETSRWIHDYRLSIYPHEPYFDLHVSFNACNQVRSLTGVVISCDEIESITRGPAPQVLHYTSAHLRASDMERVVITDEPQSTAPACYADCDKTTGVGVLDIFDFLCFGNQFAAGNSYACNCDLSTGLNVCDIFDFLCFGNGFARGCP